MIGSAIADALAAIRVATPPAATIVLVTGDPLAPGPRAPYVLYHRALERLYPRRVWWAALGASPRWPAWWSFLDDPADLPALARRVGADTLIAVDLPAASAWAGAVPVADGLVMIRLGGAG